MVLSTSSIGSTRPSSAASSSSALVPLPDKQLGVGEYDEARERMLFQQAVLEWRTGNKSSSTSKNASSGTDGGLVSDGTASATGRNSQNGQLRDLMRQIKICSPSLSHADRIYLYKHRRQQQQQQQQQQQHNGQQTHFIDDQDDQVSIQSVESSRPVSVVEQPKPKPKQQPQTRKQPKQQQPDVNPTGDLMADLRKLLTAANGGENSGGSARPHSGLTRQTSKLLHSIGSRQVDVNRRTRDEVISATNGGGLGEFFTLVDVDVEPMAHVAIHEPKKLTNEARSTPTASASLVRKRPVSSRGQQPLSSSRRTPRIAASLDTGTKSAKQQVANQQAIQSLIARADEDDGRSSRAFQNEEDEDYLGQLLTEYKSNGKNYIFLDFKYSRNQIC